MQAAKVRASVGRMNFFMVVSCVEISPLCEFVNVVAV
jgi:hypothetical protein